jgi:hypothetical protein
MSCWLTNTHCLPSGQRRGDTCAKERQSGFLGVHRQDRPAASQQFQRLAAIAAAQAGGQAPLPGARFLAGCHEQRPRLAPG